MPSPEETATVDIAQLARLSGVTSRTLRHYHRIGLLIPARTGTDGRRHYGPAELLRLQHILVLRELDVSLERIGRIVDAQDPTEAVVQLRHHLAGLTAERDRYARLATTLTRTIDSLEKGKTLTETQLFDGFDHVSYEPEARERWGDATVDSSNANWERLGAEGKRRHMQTDREIVEALGAAVRVGFAANSPEVQEVVASHHAWVSAIWTPDADAYRGLTQMYVDDDRFRTHYDEIAPGAAQLLRDGAVVFARKRL